MSETPSMTGETLDAVDLVGESSQPASSSMAAILASVRAAVREEVRDPVAAQISGQTGGQQATTSASPPGPSSTGPTASVGE